ncbi:S26 family signal peptidase [Arthrobacter sp. UYCu712]|uniref:S26 family signal peptidase n=1 Tax=Arthrobacter sp. UYCu712 TaxID=3156340 RepID=UPI003391A727
MTDLAMRPVPALTPDPAPEPALEPTPASGVHTAPAAPSGGQRSAHHRARRTGVLSAWVLSVVVGILVVAAVVLYLAGGRWFIISTPSMGEAAPVGTLVVTSPEPVSTIRAGDVITFHPPTAPGEVYTHRVQALTDPGSLTTRGDINGANDPWTLHQEDLIGRSVAVLPGLGWLVRTAPLLLLGTIFLWVLTRRWASSRWRAPLRMTGLSVVFSAAAFIWHPFTGFVLLTARTDQGGAQAAVVSTGLLPIRVRAAGGSYSDLTAGQVGDLSIPSMAQTGYYQLSSALNLSAGGWVILALLCALPLLWCLIVGLPPDTTARDAKARGEVPA